MATSTTPRPALGDEELQKLLELIKGADSVELKLTVPEQDQRSTIRALGLDPLQAEIRQVFFLDTADLALDKQGLVVRADGRRKRGTTRSSSFGRWFRPSSRRRFGAPRASGSRSTRRLAGLCAPGR